MQQQHPMVGQSTGFGDQRPEYISAGVTRSWLMNRRIVVFTVTSAARSEVDAWINCVKETMVQWPKTQPYLAIHDLTSDKAALTPYARHRTEELLPLNTGAPGYAAILMRPTLFARLVDFFLRAQSRQGNTNRIFYEIEKAKDWLIKQTS